jgi:hypothetical protein
MAKAHIAVGEYFSLNIYQDEEKPIMQYSFQIENHFRCSYLFCRVLAMVDMQLIGRNYFNPKLAVQIPQHK